MKKNLEEKGQYGIARGAVEIKFNYRKETKMIHNPVLHEETL